MRSYSNKFGWVNLELVGRYKSVSEIRSGDVPENCFIDIEIAEQIVLISDNHRVQIAFPMDKDNKLGRPYIIVHETANAGCIARVIDIEYMGKNSPNKELELARLVPKIHLAE